jgi:F0F1-type ATP synthase membrane subunit b/b'
MNIIPDPLQVLLNTLPFLVAVVGMYRIILKPMLSYLLERDVAIKGGHTEAARIEGEIADRMAEYEAKLAAARDEIGTLRADKRAEAQGQYDVAIAAEPRLRSRSRLRSGRSPLLRTPPPVN